MKHSQAKARIQQQLADLDADDAKIIAASPATLLQNNATKRAQLQESLAAIQRVEASAVSNSQPSAEEQQLWSEIRDLSEREAGIMRQLTVSERYIRVDAIEHFHRPILEARAKFDGANPPLPSHQKAGARAIATRVELEAMENAWPVTRKICEAGQRLFAIREQKKELLARREALKAERESRILAQLQ